MKFLLDTNVISELRKAPSKAHRNVVRWKLSVDARMLYLSAITIHELELGILLLARRDRSGGDSLRNWLQNQILIAYAGRIIPVDSIVAQQSAALHASHSRPWADALIAATALVHGLTVVTRNVSDFHATGVKILNPCL
ncbi:MULTISPECIES: type II toxin-antitoxin system VapC family toxin [unclassified Duganella]|uniref:type II toxin-antitoxin system VapC family toxin n=1 Tax=unclassified Duganella TaxID=2636909 RepID=UPI000B7FC5D3|nr:MULTISPECIES: type II toxin-antitoxin system VapC family toxin [unclassified Duganella]